MSIIVGPWTVDVIDTGSFGLDGGAMFGVVPKTLWERAYTAADTANRIPMVARCLLLRSATETMLVDTGNPHHMAPKLQTIYAMDFSHDTLERSLATFGVTTDAVTHVVLTHLHFDHAGGTIVADGEHFRPRFAHARHIVQAEHLRWAERPTPKDRASFMPETWRTLQEAGLLDTVDGPGAVLPGVDVQPLHGHSRAMQAVTVRGSGATVLFAADLMPTAAHVPVPYVMGYDNEPLRTIEEKATLLPRAAEEGWTVVFEHDALRQASTIVATTNGFQAGEPVVVTP